MNYYDFYDDYYAPLGSFWQPPGRPSNRELRTQGLINPQSYYSRTDDIDPTWGYLQDSGFLDLYNKRKTGTPLTAQEVGKLSSLIQGLDPDLQQEYQSLQRQMRPRLMQQELDSLKQQFPNEQVRRGYLESALRPGQDPVLDTGRWSIPEGNQFENEITRFETEGIVPSQRLRSYARMKDMLYDAFQAPAGMPAPYQYRSMGMGADAIDQGGGWDGEVNARGVNQNSRQSPKPAQSTASQQNRSLQNPGTGTQYYGNPYQNIPPVRQAIPVITGQWYQPYQSPFVKQQPQFDPAGGSLYRNPYLIDNGGRGFGDTTPFEYQPVSSNPYAYSPYANRARMGGY